MCWQVLLTHYCSHKLAHAVAISIVFCSFVFKHWAAPSCAPIKVMNDFVSSKNIFYLYGIHYDSFLIEVITIVSCDISLCR